MSAYTIEKMADRPVLVITHHAAYKPAEHIESLIEELFAALDSVDEPVFVISVLVDAQLNVQDMMAAGNIQAKYTQRFHEHPNYRGILYVPSPKFLPHYKKVMEGLKTDQFGGQRGIVMESLEDALTYVDNS